MVGKFTRYSIRVQKVPGGFGRMWEGPVAPEGSGRIQEGLRRSGRVWEGLLKERTLGGSRRVLEGFGGLGRVWEGHLMEMTWKGVGWSGKVRDGLGNGIISMWEELPVVLISQ